MKQQTVTLGGVNYDAHTGMRLTPKHSASRVTAHPSSVVHARTQHSTTLNRQIAAKNHRKSMDFKPRHRVVAPSSSARHPMVTRFAPNGTIETAPEKVVADTPDIAPTHHPRLEQANAHLTARRSAHHPTGESAATLSSREIKQRAVSHALATAPSHAAAHHQIKTKRQQSRLSRGFSIAGASLALLLLAGYFTYINMPNLSVRVAAAQAGIDASYPGYHPDGYNLSGPIAYDTGSVSMKFASTGGPQNYTVTESRSDWDSSAVQQNYAQAKWGSDVSTVVEHGLTIYTHGTAAAWVNNGIFYTISGDAPLSPEQLSDIAVSM